MSFECSDAEKIECVADPHGCGIIWRYADGGLKELLQGNTPECAKTHITRELEWRTITGNTVPDGVLMHGDRKPRPWDTNPE